MKKRANSAMVLEDDALWDRFWTAYPKRVGKKDARLAWSQINPSPAVVEQMVAALAWQSQQLAWSKDDGQFVPYPATWLRAERWTDEQPTQLQASTPMTTVLRKNADMFAQLTGRKQAV